MNDVSPFHAGELALQERAGVAHKAEAGGRVGIRPFMPDQHRLFFQQLPFLIVGSADASGAPTASILVGEPGFVQSPDPLSLHIAARPLAGDPLASHLKPGARLGLLGLEPQTRRRNRMNGRITSLSPQGFAIGVEQSFGNCPQYIQAREPRFVGSTEALPPIPEGSLLSASAQDLIRRSDTFFIATSAGADDGDPRHGIDVSHRGGKPGFLRVSVEEGASTLIIPDFRGNNFFNTLGNIARHPQAGLLFIDFDKGDVLQLSVVAEVLLDDPLLAEFTGAQRLLRARVEGGRLLPGALPLRWSAPQMAPQLEKTGSWVR